MIIEQKEYHRTNYKLECDSSKLRFVKEVHKGEPNSALHVIISPLMWFSIPTSLISLDEFLNNYYVKDLKVLAKKIVLVNSHCLPCQRCYGKGYIDWIEKIISKRPLHESSNKGTPFSKNFEINQVVNHYRMVDKIPNVHEEIKYSKPIYITTTPKFNKGCELCPTCFGCGISLNKPGGNVYYWNDLDLWYKKRENPDS